MKSRKATAAATPALYFSRAAAFSSAVLYIVHIVSTRPYLIAPARRTRRARRKLHTLSLKPQYPFLTSIETPAQIRQHTGAHILAYLDARMYTHETTLTRARYAELPSTVHCEPGTDCDLGPAA